MKYFILLIIILTPLFVKAQVNSPASFVLFRKNYHSTRTVSFNMTCRDPLVKLYDTIKPATWEVKTKKEKEPLWIGDGFSESPGTKELYYIITQLSNRIDDLEDRLKEKEHVSGNK